MDQRELLFDFQSIIDPGVAGSGAMSVHVDGTSVTIEICMKYNENSTFKPGTVRAMNLQGIRDPKNKKVVVSSPVTSIEQQISVSVSFASVFPVAYYSSISPLDAGAIKPRGHAAAWKEAFDMLR